MTERIAVVYDFLQVVGGAELVSLELARRLSQADLWVSGIAARFPRDRLPPNIRVLDPKPLPERADFRALKTIFNFRRARGGLDDYDRIIVGGHYAPLMLGKPTEQKRIYYAHTTPLPFLFEDHARASNGRSRVGRLVFRRFGHWLFGQFCQALGTMSAVYANSGYTADAFRARLGVLAQVLPPPCDVSQFKGRSSKGYFLSFARQEPGKRVDLIVKAFLLRPDLRLVVASDGNEHEYLAALARGYANVHFRRTTDPAAIQDMLARCRATVYIPLNEPFGLSAVESLAAGKPVIAASSGGLTEIVTHGETGWMLHEPVGPDHLASVLDVATDEVCASMTDACRRMAHRYSWDAFLNRLMA